MWKVIWDWENYYVNEDGDVENNKTGKLLIGDVNNYGYYRVMLNKNKLRKRFFRHRLVGEYFVENPMDLPEINHKDGNKSNNFYKNLEWCTRSLNEQHCWDNGLKHYNSGTIKNKPIIVTFNDGIIKKYVSQGKLSKDINVSTQIISRWLNGTLKSYYKYNIKSIKYINA